MIRLLVKSSVVLIETRFSEENRKFAEYQRWWSKKFWEISYLEYKIACESNPHERIQLISCSVLFIACCLLLSA